tara:strand:- start:225 stop:497 length:273 start_codon:yes stop_codon:yes gene_type:complete
MSEKNGNKIFISDINKEIVEENEMKYEQVSKIMMMKDILKLINKVDDIEQKIINLEARERHSTREIMLMIETITSEIKEQSNASKKEKSV